MKPSQIKNIQALRGLAALMVLAAHVGAMDAEYGGTAILPDQLRIGVIGVDLFFLISGFVMVHVARRMAPGWRNVLRFAYNRAARIYPLYWIATIAMIVLFFGRAALFGEATETGKLIPSLLLLPQASFPILTVGWTLIYEMYFYLAFALILLAAPRRMPLMLLLWGAIVALGSFAGWTKASPWTELVFSPLTFEFLIGAGIALLIDWTSGKWGAPALAAGAAIVLGQIFFFNDAALAAMVNNQAVRAMTYAPPFALMLYGAAAMERAQGLVLPRWMAATGDASYALYLFHLPAVMVAAKLVSVVLGERGVFDNLAIIALATAGSIVAAFLIYRLIERPALAMTKRLGDRLIAPHDPPLRQERIW